MTLEACLPFALFRGTMTEEYSLSPRGEYYIVAACFNVQGRLIADAARSEKIVAPAPSAATVT